MSRITMGAAAWNAGGNCRSGDPERLFVTGAKQRDARRICRNCPVLAHCLAMALDERIEFGVWGGTTERERRSLLRTRPDVTSWRSLLIEPTGHGVADTPPSTPTHPAVPQRLAALIPLVPKHRHADTTPPEEADAA